MSDNVIDFFPRRNHANTMQKLQAIVDKHRDEILRDPFPVLSELQRRNAALHKFLERLILINDPVLIDRSDPVGGLDILLERDRETFTILTEYTNWCKED